MNKIISNYSEALKEKSEKENSQKLKYFQKVLKSEKLKEVLQIISKKLFN